MLHIKGRKTSGNVMKVTWILEELKIPYEREDVGGKFGKNDKQDYLDLNPMGLVPTFIDGDIVLWESNTIVRYVANKFSSGDLSPVDDGERAILELWMDWQLFAINPMMRPIYHGMIRTKPVDRNLDEINRNIMRGNELWGILDRHLEDKEYIGGSKLTIADFPLGPVIHRYHSIVEDRPSTPNIDRWYNNLKESEAYQKIVMIPLE
jgi:glutathione S-transferase